MIQGVIFDMDGVLADTEHFYQCRREDYLDRMDFPGPRGVDFVGSNERAIWETLVPQRCRAAGTDAPGLRAYRRFHPEDYSKLADPQVKPMFEELQPGGDFGWPIASLLGSEAIRRFMEAAGVTGLVDYVISGEECAAHKPDPEIYLRAMAAWALPLRPPLRWRILPTGIAAARNAGMTVLCSAPPAIAKRWTRAPPMES